MKTAVKKSKKEVVVKDEKLKNSLKVIDQVKHKVGDLAITMSANLVKTKEQYDLALVQGKQGSDAIKDIKSAAEKETRDAEAFVKRVKANVKAIVTPIEAAQKVLRERCAEWLKKDLVDKNKKVTVLTFKKVEAETKLLGADTTEEQQKLEDKTNKIEDKIEAIVTDVPEGMVMERKFRITHLDLVPRAYMVVDEKALRTAGGGVNEPLRTDIAGVEYYDEPKVAFR